MPEEKDAREQAKHEAFQALLDACKYAYEQLMTLTTDDYSKGGDKAVRKTLLKAVRVVEPDYE